jgi:hypothetical protein
MQPHRLGKHDELPRECAPDLHQASCGANSKVDAELVEVNDNRIITRAPRIRSLT